MAYANWTEVRPNLTPPLRPEPSQKTGLLASETCLFRTAGTTSLVRGSYPQGESGGAVQACDATAARDARVSKFRKAAVLRGRPICLLPAHWLRKVERTLPGGSESPKGGQLSSHRVSPRSRSGRNTGSRGIWISSPALRPRVSGRKTPGLSGLRRQGLLQGE